MAGKHLAPTPKVNITVTFLSLFLSLFITSSAMAQTEPPAHSSSESNHFTFDVVSIRPSGKDVQPGLKILPDGYEAKGMSLENTILLAYFPAPFFKHDDELKGAPSWVSNQAYDIEARIPPSQVNEWQSLNQDIMQTPMVLQAMLRAMLADRCKLILHSTPSQVDGYALTLNGHPLKLANEHSGEQPSTPGVKLLDGGTAIRSMKDEKPVWTFSNTSMTAFIGFLSLNAEGPIEDKTGLQGKYQFTLRAVDSESAPSEPAEGSSSEPDAAIPWDIGKLGLTLRKIKVPAQAWTIDHIEQPSPN